MCVRENRERYRERKRNGDDDQVRAWSGGRGKRGAGEKESRVSRVTIRFGTAAASVGSWALCPFVIPCMEYATYARGYIASDTGMQHAPFRITRRWWCVNGKRSERDGERQRDGGRERDARVVETLTCFLAPERFPFSRVENSSTSCRGYSPSERYSEGRRERENGIFI